MGNANKHRIVQGLTKSGATTEATATKALAASLRLSIYRVVRSFERADQLLVEPLGVTVSQAYALLALPGETTISMGELSERLEVAGSTATRMVDQLARKGLVERAPAEEDRRVWSVSLTPEGKEVREHLDGKFRHFFLMLVERFPEEERADLVSSMEKVTTILAQFVAIKLLEHKSGETEDEEDSGLSGKGAS